MKKLNANQRQRIKDYEFLINYIIKNPNEDNFVCSLAWIHSSEIDEYLLFNDHIDNGAWLDYQINIDPNCNHTTNEFRIFILQLCIEMVKTENI